MSIHNKIKQGFLSCVFHQKSLEGTPLESSCSESLNYRTTEALRQNLALITFSLHSYYFFGPSSQSPSYPLPQCLDKKQAMEWRKHVDW